MRMDEACCLRDINEQFRWRYLMLKKFLQPELVPLRKNQNRSKSIDHGEILKRQLYMILRKILKNAQLC